MTLQYVIPLGCICCGNVVAQTTTPKFYCDADSIIYSHLTELVNQRIDTILQVQYRYDNGFSKKNTDYILWQDNGQISLIQVAGYNNCVVSKYADCDFKSNFNYYFQNRIDTITTEIDCPVRPSHNMGYGIDFIYNGEHHYLQVMDYERGVKDNLDEEALSEDDSEYKYLSDPRVRWVNKLELTINKHIKLDGH